jgi:TonB family protein
VNTNNNQTLQLSIAAFIAIVFHALLAMLISLSGISFLDDKEKTIPFRLISADKSSQIANAQVLSAEENAQAAQQYLATLNQARYTTNTADKGAKSTGNNKQNKPSEKNKKSEFNNTQLLRGSNSSTAIHGLQNIFAKKSLQANNTHIEQISSKEAEALSNYEIELLNTLAKDSLYDPFHKIMEESQRKSIAFTVTLSLFPNGAIKNANIKQTSGIHSIDQLAIQTAYRASPFPPPPRDDIQKGYRYDIPIIYQRDESKDK